MDNNITYDEMDDILENLDALKDDIPVSLICSSKDVQKNRKLIDEHFKQFAPYLLWMSETIKCSDDDDDRQLNRLISDIFAEHVIA